MLVELRGVEPLTSCMPCKRSSQLSYSPTVWKKEQDFDGRCKRLSDGAAYAATQLSYSPIPDASFPEATTEQDIHEPFSMQRVGIGQAPRDVDGVPYTRAKRVVYGAPGRI